MTPCRRAAIASVLVLLASGPARAETVTSEQAIEQAAAENPSLRAVMHDLAAARYGVDAEDNALLPTFFAGGSGEYNERFSGSSRGIARSDDQALNGNLGIRYTTPIGTQLELGVTSGVSWRTTIINPATTEQVTIGPNYTGQVYLTARQPLLRGAGTDSVLAPLRQAESAKSQAEHERDRAASQLVLDVLTAYWELWYAERALAAQQQAEALAVRQLKETRLKAEELGTAPRTDVLRFASELAVIRDGLAAAESNRLARAIELGRLLGMQPRRARQLSVADSAPPEDATPPMEVLLALAREQSSELRAMKAQVEQARERLRAAEDADQPRLDLLASGSMGGLWADDNLPGLALPGGRPVFGVMVGLELEVPMGPTQASAEAARARQQLKAAEARYEALAESIEAQVASLHIQLESADRQVQLARESADLAGELAEAERQRLELGTTTTSEVVRAQQTQRESDLRRLRAVVDQAAARFQLDHQVGDLLPRFAAYFRDKSS